ncbi:hypothetical protein, partial [Sphingomonas sp. 67-41]|uniref:hypothetical protein n=1 Tax=Sphingomonas sp. 67-41 TaxID=1895850 RepID=UPI00257B9766
VPFRRRSPRYRGPFSTPIHSCLTKPTPGGGDRCRQTRTWESDHGNLRDANFLFSGERRVSIGRR